jgi:hypothetical protein
MSRQHQGFVAVLDVLGFADRITNEAVGDGLDAYIETVVERVERYSSVHTILFSDTVVLFTQDDEDNSFRHIISLTSRLTFSLLAKNIPVRGAISHGRFLRSDSEVRGTVIAGRPIVEAHYFESRLQWIGVMLAPSVLRHLPKLPQTFTVSGRLNDEEPTHYMQRTRRAARIQRCQEVPVESVDQPRGSLEAFAVVPLRPEIGSVGDLTASLEELIEKLQWLKQLAPDPRSQSKYTNSIKWLREILDDWTKHFA